MRRCRSMRSQSRSGLVQYRISTDEPHRSTNRLRRNGLCSLCHLISNEMPRAPCCRRAAEAVQRRDAARSLGSNQGQRAHQWPALCDRAAPGRVVSHARQVGSGWSGRPDPATLRAGFVGWVPISVGSRTRQSPFARGDGAALLHHVGHRCVLVICRRLIRRW